MDTIRTTPSIKTSFFFFSIDSECVSIEEEDAHALTDIIISGHDFPLFPMFPTFKHHVLFSIYYSVLTFSTLDA